MTGLTSAVTRDGAAIATTSATQRAAELVLAGGTIPPFVSRVANAFELERVRQELAQMRVALVESYVRAARRAGNGVAGVVAVLHKASTYRARTRFDDAPAMQTVTETLDDKIAHGAPITLVLPVGGGKAPNPLKTADWFLPDAGEWVAWVHLAALAEAIGQVHAAGAIVVTVPDAGLHTADLGVAASEVAAHVAAAQRDLAWLGISDLVEVPDTLRFLPARWVDEVRERTRDARARARARGEAAFASNVDEQVRSLLFSLNVRAFAWPFDRQVLVAAALGGSVAGLPADVVQDASELRRQVERIAYHYVGVNHALRTLAVPGVIARELTGDDAPVRLTVHAKAGEPRPMLVPSNRLARPGLLPMHSLGLRFAGDDGARFAGVFALEARLRGDVAVCGEDGRLLWLEPGAVGELVSARAAA